jgi:hypothetical protein
MPRESGLIRFWIATARGSLGPKVYINPAIIITTSPAIILALRFFTAFPLDFYFSEKGLIRGEN